MAESNSVTIDLADLEALDPPAWFGLNDEYVADPNYDLANDSIDPETRREGNFASEPSTLADSFVTMVVDAKPPVKK